MELNLRRCPFVIAALMLLAQPAVGVVVNVADGKVNASPPADDPGFANVGIRGTGSAIYLGNRWVLTGVHVGPGEVILGGKSYPNRVEDTYRLSNTNEDLSPLSDIILLRLHEDPGLPSLRLGCRAVGLGDEVTLIGAGRDRHATPTYWSVHPLDGDDNDIWSETNAESADEIGFKTSDSRTIRWGRNLVTLTGFDAESGWGDVLSFQTSFQDVLPIDNLAQGVSGDSGGAVFRKDDDIWELAGMMHAITLKDNQPGETTTAIFGNETYAADLYRYADQIRAIADFEPALADFNADGEVSASDIDQLYRAINSDEIDSCHYDLTGNGQLNSLDVDEWLLQTGSLMGDADLDGEVGFGDFLHLSREFGRQGAGWDGGDFDGDGETTFTDFLRLATNFGKTAATVPMTSMSVQSVPEPETVFPGMCGILGILLIWRHSFGRRQ